MSADNIEKLSLKQKAVHEFWDFACIFLYLAFFFCALFTYSMLLLGKFAISYFTYSVAVINALVIAKVILIGEYVRLGRKYEAKPLLYSSVYKALLFTLLVLAFHILEEVIKRAIHGQGVAGTFREVRVEDLLGRSLIVFCTFIPLFAFRQLERALGERNFRDLFFRTGVVPKSGLATRI